MRRVARIRFTEVFVKGTRYWREGGKSRQETRKFSQTVNPFNKGADGQLKTPGEIFREVSAERDAWLKVVERYPRAYCTPAELGGYARVYPDEKSTFFLGQGLSERLAWKSAAEAVV